MKNYQNIEEQSNQHNNNQSLEPEVFRKVFILEISEKTDDVSLKNYFAKYGEVIDCSFVKATKSRKRGFVIYSLSSMVDEIMKNRPHIIDKKQISLTRRNFFNPVSITLFIWIKLSNI